MSGYKLLLGCSGVYGAYLLISFFNEKLFRNYYKSVLVDGSGTHPQELFNYADLPVGLSALFCCVFTFLSSKVARQPPNPIPLREIVLVGVLYAINILTINYALLYVPYPVRVVVDKFGYLTAVVVAVYFTRMGHPMEKEASSSNGQNSPTGQTSQTGSQTGQNSKAGSKKPIYQKLGVGKMVIAVIITVGVLLFVLMKEDVPSDDVIFDPAQEWKGYVLLIVSVVAEAFFSDSQAYIKFTYQPTINQLMCSVNFITFLISLAKLLLYQQMVPAIQFCRNHPSVIADLLVIASFGIVGQLSIYYIVMNFQQHIFPLIATSRKVITVLFSIWIYKHVITAWQWVGMLMVFGGMAWQLTKTMNQKRKASSDKSIQSQKSIGSKTSNSQASNKSQTSISQKSIKSIDGPPDKSKSD